MGGWGLVGIFYGWVGVNRGIFWVGDGGWTFLMGGWGRVKVYFGSVVMGRHF